MKLVTFSLFDFLTSVTIDGRNDYCYELSVHSQFCSWVFKERVLEFTITIQSLVWNLVLVSTCNSLLKLLKLTHWIRSNPCWWIHGLLDQHSLRLFFLNHFTGSSNLVNQVSPNPPLRTATPCPEFMSSLVNQWTPLKTSLKNKVTPSLYPPIPSIHFASWCDVSFKHFCASLFKTVQKLNLVKELKVYR